MIRRAVWLALALVAACGWAWAAGDLAAAERQYRVALRLAADAAPGAEAALMEVVRLAPDGPLADDALLEAARLDPLPAWPEQTGRLGAIEGVRAMGRLDRLVREHPGSDRAAEARYLRGLLRLEPLPGHDASAARVDLTAAATASTDPRWSGAARYALGWLDEQEGRLETARAAYQRLLVDTPSSAAAARARVRAARLALRGGVAGRAARLAQDAIATDPAENPAARSLREHAVRVLLRLDYERAVTLPTGLRSLSAFAVLPDGGALFADRRTGRVVQHGADGPALDAWQVEPVHSMAVDPRGRRFVVSDDWVLRLDDGGRLTRVAALEPFAAAPALAADGIGNLWLADRKGQTIGVVRPGSAVATAVWSDREVRLGALAWDGARLVATDTRARRVVALEDGRLSELHRDDRARIDALVPDGAGRLGMFDSRAGSITFLGGDGRGTEPVLLAALGIARSAAVGLGTDGKLHVFDAGDGSWVRFR